MPRRKHELESEADEDVVVIEGEESDSNDHFRTNATQGNDDLEQYGRDDESTRVASDLPYSHSSSSQSGFFDLAPQQDIILNKEELPYHSITAFVRYYQQELPKEASESPALHTIVTT